MRRVSQKQTDSVVSLLQAGKSVRDISKSLQIGLGTISRIKKKHCSTIPTSTGGRPRKLSQRDVQHAVRLITSGQSDTATDVTKSLRDITNQDLSPQTVRRYLKEAGMKSAVKKKKALLSSRHRKTRMEWAEAHKDYTVADWKRVVWTDETKINRLGSDGRAWVWKKAGEGLSRRTVEGTVKFGGGSVMIWGCMLWDGVGYVTKIDGRMDADLYSQILKEELMDSLKFYDKEPSDIIFQQDNDPKHTSKKAKKVMEELGLEVMKWPAQSPDLNPIEHLWFHLKQRLAAYPTPPSGVHELWERVQEE
jgi:transposase